MDTLLELKWLSYLLAGIAGYLIGSISFPRIMHRILFNRAKHTSGEDSGDKPSEFLIQSATFVGKEYGKKYGCVASLLDMIKVAVPTLLVLLAFQDQIHYLITALFAIVGNNYPIYYKFKGGAGYSALMGAVFVINWFGIFIANGAAMVLGYLLGSVMVMRIAGNILYIFWFWIYFNDIFHVGFIVLANVVFWSSVTRLLRRIPEAKKRGGEEVNQEYWSKRLLMGGKFGRFIDEYSLPALMKKIIQRSHR